jgi:hypothetical protein
VDTTEPAHQVSSVRVEHNVSGLDEEIRFFAWLKRQRVLRFAWPLPHKWHAQFRFPDHEGREERLRVGLANTKLRDAGPVQTDQRIGLVNIEYSVLPPSHLGFDALAVGIGGL